LIFSELSGIYRTEPLSDTPIQTAKLTDYIYRLSDRS
jgi:hypothetical protein